MNLGVGGITGYNSQINPCLLYTKLSKIRIHLEVDFIWEGEGCLVSSC